MRAEQRLATLAKCFMTEAHRVGGLVLASGLSRRFGATNKLLAHVEGKSIVRRTVEAYVSVLDRVWVVIGHEATAVAETLNGLPVSLVENREFREGQSRALVRGVEALRASTTAAVIGVADQPYLTPQIITALCHEYVLSRASLVIPHYGGRPGNPVLFDRSLYAELAGVTGDVGGRHVIARHRDEAAVLEMEDTRAGRDVDHPEDLR